MINTGIWVNYKLSHCVSQMKYEKVMKNFISFPPKTTEETYSIPFYYCVSQIWGFPYINLQFENYK